MYRFAIASLLALSLLAALPTATLAAAKAPPPPDAAKSAAPDTTPAPPGAPNTLEGVWEVAMQRGAQTTYSHLMLKTTKDGVGGFWRNDGKDYPLTGTYDGHNFHVAAILPDKSTVSFSGYIDSPSDMVGLIDFGKETVPFTAAHRDKVKLLDTVGPGLPQ